VPVIEALAGRLKIPISVDTYRAEVARRALDAGAQAVNDISAFRFDARMAEVVRSYGAGVVLMHSRGSRETLHQQAPMADAAAEVLESLKRSADLARKQGIGAGAIVLDPGIGFGKKAEESLQVLRHIATMSSQLEYPLLVGTSRKSFIGKIVADAPEARLWGTAATVAVSILQGAHLVRVHDVGAIRILADVLDALMG
jgi:dihydropteroate synthase